MREDWGGRQSNGIIAVALTAMLIGCNDTHTQRMLATTASERFQSLYNTGSCEQIYDGASLYFRMHESRARWLRDCGELRSRLGSWIEFTPASNNSWPIGSVGIVWVRGPARFGKGTAEARLDWDVTNGRATLFNVLIERGSEQVSIPGFTGEVRR